jgi:Tfp pilus assembly protein PilN
MTAPVTEQLDEVEGPSVTRVEWAPVARVNLLPREIAEGRRFRHVQRGLAAVVLLVLCAAGAAYWWSEQKVTEARDSLEAVQAETVRLQARQRSFAEVPTTLAALEAAEGARADVMTNDVLWHRYLTDIRDAAPDGVTFEALSFKVNGPVLDQQAAAATPGTEQNANPFAPAGAVGSVSIQGISGSYPEVADWMDAIEEVNGLEVTVLESATGSTEGDSVSFSGSITITADALSHRYDRKAS